MSKVKYDDVIQDFYQFPPPSNIHWFKTEGQILFKQYNFLLETVKCYKFSYKKMIYKCYNLPYITLEIP